MPRSVHSVLSEILGNVWLSIRPPPPSPGGAGPEKEEEKPEQTEARQTEGRMRLTATTRTVAGRAPRCRFGGHVRGEFPFALGASRLGFLFSSTGLHTTTHPYIYIDDDDGALYHCPACEGGCDNKWLCPKNKSSSYFRALLGSTRNGRRTPTPWASNQREKSDTHTHTHTHTLDSPIPTTPKAYMKHESR